eukprot:TRINITY_DN13645_c0_g1_i3.p5 TRINITY_DN13645_c0_g1~~TRINITY_DN13645_c0_g1_i3.p5  ORF type:complete len:121 (-),score=4.32 TRINITY_DN13645_c0_g1_i3:16-378(-)
MLLLQQHIVCRYKQCFQNIKLNNIFFVVQSILSVCDDFCAGIKLAIQQVSSVQIVEFFFNAKNDVFDMVEILNYLIVFGVFVYFWFGVVVWKSDHSSFVPLTSKFTTYQNVLMIPIPLLN